MVIAAPVAPAETDAPEAGWQLILIDGFELRFNGRPVPVGQSSARLLAFLALAEHPVTRSYISGSLWLDSDTEHANACLRSALWRMPAVGAHRPVFATATHLSLANSVSVDYRALVALARGLVQQHKESSASSWTFAELASLDGELLPECYDDWAILEKERYRQLRLHALDTLAHQLCTAHRFGEAVHVGLTAVAADPLRESAHRRVIEVHLAEGNRVEAIRQYRAYATLLDAELGVRPSTELRRLVDSSSVANTVN